MYTGRHSERYLRPWRWRAKVSSPVVIPLLAATIAASRPASLGVADATVIPQAAPPPTVVFPHERWEIPDPVRHDRATAIRVAQEVADKRKREAAARRRAEARAAAEERRRVARRQAARAAALARENAERVRRRALEATRRPPGAVNAGRSNTSGKAAAVLAAARSLLGRPYCRGGEGSCLDCSGFTLLAYRAVGLSLPHYSGSQPGHGHRVSVPQPGDLAWRPGHVAIVLRPGVLIGARRSGVASSIYSDYGGFSYYRMF